MSGESMDGGQIRRAGMDALMRELGMSGAMRFMQLIRQVTGDYTADRHTWLPDGDVEGLVDEIRRRKLSTAPEPEETPAAG